MVEINAVFFYAQSSSECAWCLTTIIIVVEIIIEAIASAAAVAWHAIQWSRPYPLRIILCCVFIYTLYVHFIIIIFDNQIIINIFYVYVYYACVCVCVYNERLCRRLLTFRSPPPPGIIYQTVSDIYS